MKEQNNLSSDTSRLLSFRPTMAHFPVNDIQIEQPTLYQPSSSTQTQSQYIQLQPQMDFTAIDTHQNIHQNMKITPTSFTITQQNSPIYFQQTASQFPFLLQTSSSYQSPKMTGTLPKLTQNSKFFQVSQFSEQTSHKSSLQNSLSTLQIPFQSSLSFECLSSSPSDTPNLQKLSSSLIDLHQRIHESHSQPDVNFSQSHLDSMSTPQIYPLSSPNMSENISAGHLRFAHPSEDTITKTKSQEVKDSCPHNFFRFETNQPTTTVTNKRSTSSCPNLDAPPPQNKKGKREMRKSSNFEMSETMGESREGNDGKKKRRREKTKKRDKAEREGDIQRAIEMVNVGVSGRVAAEFCNVPRSTLWVRMHMNHQGKQVDDDDDDDGGEVEEGDLSDEWEDHWGK
jgi:hypothetical protein